MKIDSEINWLFDEIVDFYYPTSPSVKDYKAFVTEELEDYWPDPFEVYLYYVNGLLTRYTYNYYDEKYDDKVFSRNMDKVLLQFGNLYFQKGIELVRREVYLVQQYVDKYKPTVWDNKTNQELQYHVEYTWKTGGHKPCEICSSNNGKPITNKTIHSHWHCRCRIQEREWYTTKNGETLYETIKIL